MFTLQTIIGALAVLSTFAHATPIVTNSRFTTSNLLISHLTTYQTSSVGKANYTQDVGLSFHVHDPDPLTNSSTTCAGQWKLNGTYPSGGYVSCSNSTFGWNFADDGYKNISSFALQVKHTFTDPSVGEAPYDKVTIFARKDITPSNLNCATIHSGIHKGERHCNHNGTIKAPVWAAIA